MKIIPGGLSPETAASARTGAASGTVAGSSAATPSARTAGEAPLQSAALGPALTALEQLPQIDEVRVAALRDALAKGELPFDAGKLAALIESYHRTGR